ncbi:MAG: tetratricopeptide repeat protein [Candidatus Thorarchaeota archaeon]
MYEHFMPSDRIFVDREEYIEWMSEALKRCKDKSVVLHLHGIGGIGKSSLLDHWTSTLDTTIRLDCQQFQDFYGRLNVLAKGAALLGIRLQKFDVLWQIRQRFVEGVEPVKEAGREWAKEIALAIPFIGSLASIGSAISAVGTKVTPKLKGKYSTLGKWLETRLGKNHVTRLLEIMWKEPRHAEFLFLDALLEDLNQRKDLDTPILFLFDHFEHVDGELTHWRYKARKIAETELWYVFLSSLSNCVGVAASRISVLKKSEIIVEDSELLELDRDSCLELLDQQGIKDFEFQERIASVSGGNPFIIGSICDMAEGGSLSLEEIEDMRGETLEEVRLKTWRKLFTEVQGLEHLVDRAGLLHFFNRRILTIIIPELNTDQWNRLIRLSFVRSLGEDKWVFHDLARELVAAELGDRISGLADEVVSLLVKKAREESDYTLLGLARSVQALASLEVTLKEIDLQIGEYDYQMATADALLFLDSIKMNSAKGQAFISRARGWVLYCAGRVADGEHAYLEALELARSVVVDEQDMDQAYVVGSLGGLAQIYAYTGRLSEAEEKFKESLRISKNLLKSHPNPQWPGKPVKMMYPLYMCYYGFLLTRQGRFDESKNSFREAERLILGYFDSSDSELKKYEYTIPFIQQGLGLALFYSGEANEAESIYRKIIKTSKRPATQFSALVNLGEVLSWIGKLSEAEEVIQETLESYQQAAEGSSMYAANLLDMVESLIHLGYILRVTHRSVDAEAHYRRALGTCRKIADERPESNRDYLALTLREFAVFLSDSGRYSEAEELILESLEHTKALADKSPVRFAIMLPRILNNHAVLQSKMGRLSEAETTLNEALDIAKQCVQEWSEPVQGYSEAVFFVDLESAILNNIGLILWSTNRIKEAQKALEDAFVLQSNLVDRAPLMFQYHQSIVLNNIGAATYRSGESSEGENYLMESLRIRRELEAMTPGRYLLDIASSLNNLAIIEEESNRIKASEDSRSEVVDILDRLALKEADSNERWKEIKANVESKRMSVEFRNICNLMI